MGIAAAIPVIIGIVRSVQGLFGKGGGDKKKEAAIKLAELQGINGPDVPDWIEVAVGILNALGAKDPQVPVGGSVELQPGKTYPVVIEVVSLSKDSIEGNLRIG